MQHIVVEKKLGQGSFANVFLVKSKHCDCRDGDDERPALQYALKIIDQDRYSEDDRINSVGEAKLMLRLHHSNIISCYDAFQFDSLLLLVTEFCPGGDMYCYLKNRKAATPIEPIEEQQIFKWLQEISSGLEYLHNLKILHRDIKTKNIFLQDNLTVQIGDLGIAKQLDFTLAEANTFLGTPMYMCPEMFKFQSYSYKADVWSFGCCVYEMMTLQFAFETPSQKDLIRKILHGELPSIPPFYSENLAKLAQSMMASDPENRPHASEIKQLVQNHLRNSVLKKIPPRQRRRLSAAVTDDAPTAGRDTSPHDGASLDRRAVINALLAYFRVNVSLGLHSGLEHKTFADSKTGLSKTVKSIPSLTQRDSQTILSRNFGWDQETDVNSGECVETSHGQMNQISCVNCGVCCDINDGPDVNEGGHGDSNRSVICAECAELGERNHVPEISDMKSSCKTNLSNGSYTDLSSLYSSDIGHSRLTGHKPSLKEDTVSCDKACNSVGHAESLTGVDESSSCDNICDSMSLVQSLTQDRTSHGCDNACEVASSSVQSHVSSVIRWAMENGVHTNHGNHPQISIDEQFEKHSLQHQMSVPDMESERKGRKKKKNFLRAYSERNLTDNEVRTNSLQCSEPSLKSHSKQDTKKKSVTLYTRSQKVTYNNSNMEEYNTENSTASKETENHGRSCEEELGQDLLFRACQLVQLLTDDNLLQAQLRDLLGWRNYKKYKNQIIKLATETTRSTKIKS